MENVDVPANLQKTYAGPDTSPTSLNTSFREALRSYAAAQSLHFTEDQIGNIYMSRSGLDVDIAPIAVTFPLDGGLSVSTFTTAFRIFSLLSEVSLPCSIVIVGWFCLRERQLGKVFWDMSAAGPLQKVPSQLQGFQENIHPKDISFSAVCRVTEEEGVPLQLEGSPILIKMARGFMTTEADIDISRWRAPRAPWVTIMGPGAEALALSTIKEYSAYIGAIFNNFD
ncbi:hypothetical protein F5Y11DRAFT_352218 [Daldinia sp. FL1419]|nr:hypothetical protein F5Y11DRAFT_352218 [Daldinia sp. FL1419]